MALAVACGGRSPLDPADGGPGTGFEPDVVIADDGPGNEPSQGPPLDLTLPGLSPPDASAPCDLCETDAPGPTPTATGDASPGPVQARELGEGWSALPNGGCSSSVQATGDGGSYQVACSCPEGACVCFGPTTKVVPFMGCPACPGGSDAFSLCGWSLTN